MPELPEVETIRRQLEPALVGRTVVAAWGFLPPKFDQAPAAVGATIEAVGRRGKYLIMPLSERRELIIHLGMTGSLSVREPPICALPSRNGEGDPDPFARAWWALDDGAVLVFRDVRRFGRIAVVPAGSYGDLPTLAALGPEPFDPAFTAAAFHRALAASDRHIKTQLLSQRPVAGVGNIYADEALWRARLNPAARQVTRPQAARLREAIIEVLASGIDNGGTTLRDYRTVDGEPGENQDHLDCYGRAGLPCPRCATPLRSRTLDARTTTFCPRCQR
jgi:formamidopyrimidine-DNA glycosylase